MRSKVKNKLKLLITKEVNDREEFLVVMDFFKSRPQLINTMVNNFIRYSIESTWRVHESLMNDLKFIGVKDLMVRLKIREQMYYYTSSIMNDLRDYIDVKDMDPITCSCIYRNIKNVEREKKIYDFILICEVVIRKGVAKEKLIEMYNKVKKVTK